MHTKKLIEVALPLEKINAESAREKSIRHGHPSTLHLWWARRPLAAARAVIWASLVDDPSSHPELFPTEEDQNRERQRLFKILEELVVWENSNNESVLNAAKAEILKSTNNNPPALLDPFAGGGAIPLEAQRLGLEAHAHDLNPVAVMINKAMIEIPPRFANMAPVNPTSQGLTKEGWTGANGLAEDVRYYGEWMKREAFKRIGHLYPKVKVPQAMGGGDATVIAWIWARTVKCPNPACGCNMPLASSFVLTKQDGKEAYVKPSLDLNTKSIEYKVVYGNAKDAISPKLTRGAKFKCIICNEVPSDDYIKEQAVNGKLGTELIGVVAERNGRRIYLSADEEQVLSARVEKPTNSPDEPLPYDPRNIWCVKYGLDTYDKLFTNRQLTALLTFSDLVSAAQSIAENDAINAGLSNDHVPLSKGGNGAFAYGQAIGVYLGFAVDRLADINNSLCNWSNNRGQTVHLFGRQAIPMVWDFAENNVFNNAAGDLMTSLGSIIRVLKALPSEKAGFAEFKDAQAVCDYKDIIVSTDPPYYDNISYADLSDFFYVWMRRSLKNSFPEVFKTLLTPKTEELIATPYRHNGNMDAAKSFFEEGMYSACCLLHKYSRNDIPVTIYYAYKQSDSETVDEGQASSGWEAILSAIIRAGFSITGTWPMRTEKEGRMISNGTNALASSIVLVCRKRQNNATICTRRSFINELKHELRPALKKLQSSNIAPVDLRQSSIGPGMGVFSKYSKVLEADGTPMSIRSALMIINQELDLYFNEQDVELDSESRFCVDLYSMVAFNDMKFGDANTLATAKGTSVAIMAAHGTVFAQKGVVHLVERQDLPDKIEHNEKCLWKLCQQLTYKMEKDGVEGCAKVVADMYGSNGERAKDLAYRLFTIAERKHWAQEAYVYNALVVAWPEIQSRAAQLKAAPSEQISLLDMLGNNDQN